jgi:MFS family permease
MNQTGGHPRGLVTSLLFVGGVSAILGSLGAPFIPSIAADLHATLSATQWSLTAPLLVGAVASPILGRLGDGSHRRAVLLWSLGAVTLGCAVAALAQTLWVLLLGRALQGLGLALLPLTMASARDHLSPVHSHEVIGLLSVIGAVGVGLGYPISGLIADLADPAAAFWFGAVCSAGALALAARFVPPATAPTTGRTDAVGATLVGAGLLALLLALERGADWGWASWPTLSLGAAAAVLLTAWTRHELHAQAPLVELRLLAEPAVLAANAIGVVLGVAMYICISLMAQVVQVPSGMHVSVFVAGLTLVPFSVLSTASSRLLPFIDRRTSTRVTIALGCVLIGAGMSLFAATGTQLWQAFVTMGLVGLGLGLTFAALPGLIVHAVPHGETSSALSLYQVARYVAFATGSALASTLLQAFSSGTGDPTPSAYAKTFAVGAAFCVGAAVVAWLLADRRPGAARSDRVTDSMETRAARGLLRPRACDGPLPVSRSLCSLCGAHGTAEAMGTTCTVCFRGVLEPLEEPRTNRHRRFDAKQRSI